MMLEQLPVLAQESSMERLIREFPPDSLPSPKISFGQYLANGSRIVKPLIPKRPVNEDKDTALIQDLNNVCEEAKKGWKDFILETKTGRAKTDQIAMINRDNFLDKGVPYFAFEICELIEGLIKFDDYEKEQFSDYREIYNKITSEKNKEERAKLLCKLIISAKAVIPMSVQFVRPKVIIPTIGKTEQSGDNQ